MGSTSVTELAVGSLGFSAVTASLRQSSKGVPSPELREAVPFLARVMPRMFLVNVLVMVAFYPWTMACMLSCDKKTRLSLLALSIKA